MKRDSILKINSRFETIVIGVLMFLLMFVVLVLTYQFIYLIVSGLNSLEKITSIPILQETAQRVFSGFLLLLLGLELMQTIKMYLVEDKFHVEIVIVVALIAVGRHIISLDFHHEDPMTLVGIAALIAALSTGYVIIKRQSLSSSTENEKQKV